jgi:hypothetical protein
VTAIPDPVVQVTGYTVTCLPEDDVAWGGTFTIRVERRGPDRWAVCRLGRCLSTAGNWDYESIPSEREDKWKAEHRFDLKTALRLAKEQAPLITVNGFTVADALERLEES